MYSVARLCPDLSFFSLCHRRRVAGLSMLNKVNSNSNHCLFSELPSASTRVRHTRAAALVCPSASTRVRHTRAAALVCHFYSHFLIHFFLIQLVKDCVGRTDGPRITALFIK